MDWSSAANVGVLGLFVGLVVCFGLGMIAGLMR